MRRPLSARIRGGPWDLEGPHDGIPKWLHSSLRNWLQNHIRFYELDFEHDGLDPDFTDYVQRHLKVQLESRNTAGLLTEVFQRSDLALDVVDLVCTAADEHELARLRQILTEAGSVYDVNIEARQLELRVDAPARDAAGAAMEREDSPSAHLREAWRATFGRHPNFWLGYSEAIKAVEAAVGPLVEPNNDRRTLGSTLGALRQDHSPWRARVFNPDGRQTDRLIRMLEFLWKGQCARHGGEDEPRETEQHEAEGAVHLAVAIVQMVRAGVLARDEE